jgi:hypothetical protein
LDAEELPTVMHIRSGSMDLSRGELVEQLATAFGNLLDLYRESERVNAEL